ncbi:hypothetical protein BDR07DRAFT_1397888, partial [Suillus spraguei]
MAPSGLILGETDSILSTICVERPFQVLSGVEVPVPYKVGIAFNTVNQLESRAVLCFRRQYIRILNEVQAFVGEAGFENWDTSLDICRFAKGIFETVAPPFSAMSEDEGTKILMHNVGLRPGQERCGPRVE